MDDDVLDRGVALFNEGHPGRAREVWEPVFRGEPQPWLHGLLLVAEALDALHTRLDGSGARRLLEQALPHLGAAASFPRIYISPHFILAIEEGYRLLASGPLGDGAAFGVVPRLGDPERIFVMVGQTAQISSRFSLDDIPSSGGRVDILLRCLRASLLVSHGLRQNTRVYLVLEGGSSPRCLRVDGIRVRFLRPDERSLASFVRRALGREPEGERFVSVRPGVSVARGGIESVFADLPSPRRTLYLLDALGPDIRDASLDLQGGVFVVGDHRGIGASTRESLRHVGALPLGVGPLELQADDAVAVLVNELDRRVWGQGR